MTDGNTQATEWPPLKPIETGIRGKCPRCGQGALFTGLLTLRKGCDHCGLDYGFADPADGPPFWVHLVTSLPFLVLTCTLPLRPLKGWLVCSQFFYKAREARQIGWHVPEQ
jgi:uncharacterized protein (DUF983 family)